MQDASDAATVRFLDRSTPPHVLTLILVAGISALNMSIFLPSLTAMSLYFEADYAIMQLAVSLYLAATAGIQIIVGPVSDRFGRRPVLLTSLALFVLFTLGAMLAQSVEVFLVFRMLQAVVATGIVLSRAIVRDMFSTEKSASMIGYVTMGMAVVPMIGPLIGGALEQAFFWQATFAFLAVAGTLVLVLTWVDLGETGTGRGMTFAEQARGFPELLRSPRFWGYVLCSAFSSGAFFALLGGASFVASVSFGLDPVFAGLALGAPAVGYIAGNYVSGRFSEQVGLNRMSLLGTGISTAAMGVSFVFGVFGDIGPVAFFGLCSFLGVGNGMTMPNAIAGSMSVRPELAGTASGLGGAIMIGGGAAMSAFSGLLLTEETGPAPLQLMMFLSSVASMVAILLVIRRARRLGEA
ncbi:multidrug effflux MFS transporter [Ponticoccus sp. SC2-23]|uniref:multidrug effflux MFS transporter n=1 Tax=Alexandriicola marinus TaxID=2081710 RepID=UPI000FDA246F|nr:multidrug effflux MFS transporter [Alexandriicola marinus]MBM1219684.1 multidrug effflux MFS transporter [Ponticoccus sp. SC6-9]MBM1223244.1 multidrug effflux MFS transporter [Ponticoccus sp. SC6-15]MBM1229497.1 multidrug effflux MFS transporter [Ponticoccus sp. SC6-38]MBM1232210.1 multidrug effflux MFS transporter [Ponticoccus sp. SC6-45]MBM1237840.1 multidrug effflux MFS transporter [Ponticoccus sp. SC6-49]MBM1241221.1 multidrug effflux MFS transporter [Ponticoccus sp. SC2-64]MBM1245734